jgi:low affinity Fe/Cu permease
MERSFFDNFAEAASRVTSRGLFFSACVLLVLVWLPSYFVLSSVSTWQLLINTLTTIVTFLLVALLQNSQRRFEQAVQVKLDAIADGLADLMTHTVEHVDEDLRRDVQELRETVGLETDAQ